MVETIKFSEMLSGGDLGIDDKTPGLLDGDNVLFNNPLPILAPGTTAQRPPVSDDIYYRLRYNTNLQAYEFYNPDIDDWVQLETGTAGVTAKQVQESAFNFKVAEGANDAFVVNLDPPVTALTNGLLVTMNSGPYTNLTATPTLQVNALPPKNIVTWGGQLLPGDITLGSYLFVYNDDTDEFYIINPTLSQAFTQAVQSNFYNYNVDSGALNAYAVVLTPEPVSSANGGFPVFMQASSTNTGPATLTVNGTTSPIYQQDGEPISGGAIMDGQIYMFLYNNNYAGWIIINSSLTLGGGDVVGPVSSTNNAIALFSGNTGKIIKNSLVTVDVSGNINMHAPPNSFIGFGGGQADGKITCTDTNTFQLQDSLSSPNGTSLSVGATNTDFVASMNNDLVLSGQSGFVQIAESNDFRMNAGSSVFHTFSSVAGGIELDGGYDDPSGGFFSAKTVRASVIDTTSTDDLTIQPAGDLIIAPGSGYVESGTTRYNFGSSASLGQTDNPNQITVFNPSDPFNFIFWVQGDLYNNDIKTFGGDLTIAPFTQITTINGKLNVTDYINANSIYADSGNLSLGADSGIIAIEQAMNLRFQYSSMPNLYGNLFIASGVFNFDRPVRYRAVGDANPRVQIMGGTTSAVDDGALYLGSSTAASGVYLIYSSAAGALSVSQNSDKTGPGSINTQGGTVFAANLTQGSANIQLNGTNAVLTGSTGLVFPTSGGTAAALNYYETGTITQTWSGIWAAPLNGDIRFTRIGDVVTLTFGFGSSTATISNSITATNALPARLRPGVGQVVIPVQVLDNGVNNFGILAISTAGGMSVFNGAGVTNFTGAGLSGVSNFMTVSYKI